MGLERVEKDKFIGRHIRRYILWGVPKMVVPNNHWFLGCFGGTTIEGNTHIAHIPIPDALSMDVWNIDLHLAEIYG